MRQPGERVRFYDASPAIKDSKIQNGRPAMGARPRPLVLQIKAGLRQQFGREPRKVQPVNPTMRVRQRTALAIRAWLFGNKVRWQLGRPPETLTTALRPFLRCQKSS